LDIHIINRIKN